VEGEEIPELEENPQGGGLPNGIPFGEEVSRGVANTRKKGGSLIKSGGRSGEGRERRRSPQKNQVAVGENDKKKPKGGRDYPG